ncbi:unnamed protein product, partial [marine sediment metagenome]
AKFVLKFIGSQRIFGHLSPLLCPDNKKVYTDFVDGVKETNVLRLLIDLTPRRVFEGMGLPNKT